MEISSKKLPSGNFQVRFSEGEFYGYVLVQPGTSLNELLNKIRRHLQEMSQTNRYYQRNLFRMENRNPQSGGLLVFRTPAPNKQAA